MKNLLLCVVFVFACGDEDPPGLFDPKPECMGAAVTPYSGTFQQVISKLAIGTPEDGFDLDGDGKPDNKLAQAANLAQMPLDDSFKNFELLMPMEYFDFETVAKDDCVKFAMYLADYVTDTDGDTKKAYVEKGDCNDNDPDIRPGRSEVAADGIDNDCDGMADETGTTPNSTDVADVDGDLQSVAAGDCNDHNGAILKGAAEICGDGLDNDCDGVADRSVDGAGNPTACSPYDGTHDLRLNAMSFTNGSEPAIAFKSGTVNDALKLVAGPSLFSIKIPVINGIYLDLRVSGATIEATLLNDGTTMTGRLGGVIDAKTADTVRGLDVPDIGLTAESSILDATFANILGPLLALPKAADSITARFPMCRTPDIDVDRDGLEAFCDSSDDGIKAVDLCIDGDGTEIHDEGGVQCSEAMKDGKPRFVDGISVELNFSTSRVQSLMPPLF